MQKEEAYVLFAHVSVVYRTASWNILSETICRQLYVPSSSGVGGGEKKKKPWLSNASLSNSVPASQVGFRVHSFFSAHTLKHMPWTIPGIVLGT